MKNRRYLTTQLLLVAIGLGLLWLAVRNVHWPDVVDILRRLGPRQLVPLLLLNFGVLIAISLRWYALLSGFGFRISFLRTMRYRTTVFALGYLTPGPQVGGEVLQVYYPTRHGMPMSVALAVASVDKTLELLGNFTFIALGSFMVLIGQHLISKVDLIALAALSSFLLIPVGLLLAIWRGRHPVSGLLLWLEALVPARWRQWLRRTPGIRSLPSIHRLEVTLAHSEDLIAWLCRARPWTLAFALLMTAAAWACTLTEFYLVTHALGLPLTQAQAVATLVLIYFAFTTPMPGGLGAVEAAIMLAFTAFGLSPSQAISLALYIRIRDLTEAGIGLLLGGLAWRRLPRLDTATLEADVAHLPPPPPSRRARATAQGAAQATAPVATPLAAPNPPHNGSAPAVAPESPPARVVEP